MLKCNTLFSFKEIKKKLQLTEPFKLHEFLCCYYVFFCYDQNYKNDNNNTSYQAKKKIFKLYKTKHL